MTDDNKPKPRRRTALSAAAIAHEALALVDAEGLEAFSFRKLARRMQCQAMSLYHYYPSKAHLFDAMVDICVDETPVPPKHLTPRQRMRALALAYRATALRHPGFARFWIVHRLNHRNALDWLNRVAEMFEEAGLAPQIAARVFRTFSYFTTGAALDEASGYTRGPSAAEPVPGAEAARDFPAISRLGPFFAKEYHLETFEGGLEVILDWFDEEIAAAKDRESARQRI